MANSFLSPHIQDESLDANLLRVVAGAIGVVGVTIILAHGGQELGLPILSILAVLGIGGLAVALAIRPTPENLFGGAILYTVMRFCRLRDSMTVIEFGPGSGWYTEILGPVLQEKGKLVIAYKDSWMEKLDALLALDFMSAVEKHPIDIGWNSKEKRFEVGDVAYAITDAGLALNIREYHNLNPEGAGRVNRATYAALKTGGYYCIIDHTRRHMEPRNQENRRRADPVKVILEVQEAGFKLVDYSDLFFKPDDELRYEVGRKTVTGNTDRFSLLFRKVEN